MEIFQKEKIQKNPRVTAILKKAQIGETTMKIDRKIHFGTKIQIFVNQKSHQTGARNQPILGILPKNRKPLKINQKTLGVQKTERRIGVKSQDHGARKMIPVNLVGIKVKNLRNGVRKTGMENLQIGTKVKNLQTGVKNRLLLGTIIRKSLLGAKIRVVKIPVGVMIIRNRPVTGKMKKAPIDRYHRTQAGDPQ